MSRSSGTGGFSLCLSERELEQRAQTLKRLHNQPGIVDYDAEMLERSEIERMLPAIGPEVVGGSFCPLDGHVNSLRLLRALHTGLAKLGAHYLPNHRVEAIAQKARRRLRADHAAGEVQAGQGRAGRRQRQRALAPMVGLKAPMRPQRGQIIVTERRNRSSSIRS